MPARKMPCQQLFNSSGEGSFALLKFRDLNSSASVMVTVGGAKGDVVQTCSVCGLGAFVDGASWTELCKDGSFGEYCVQVGQAVCMYVVVVRNAIVAVRERNRVR